jgi:TFIIF-interacting CTD phosphatase-like protein
MTFEYKSNKIVKSHTFSNDNNKNKQYFIDEKVLNIVLDLDNTIIYTKKYDSTDILSIKISELFKKDNYLGKFQIDNKTFLVYIRPYFNYFLNTITMYFNLYIYTNSSKKYCISILDLIKKKFFNFDIKKIICREDNFSLIKNLTTITDNIDDLHFLEEIPSYNDFINKTIIIDDSEIIWQNDKENLFQVKPFINDDSIFTKNSADDILDDTLLILSNRLFTIYNFYISNYEQNNNFNIRNLISKYKL